VCKLNKLQKARCKDKERWKNVCFVNLLFTKGEKVWIFMKTILCRHLKLHVKVKVKWSRYRPGVAQRVGRGIALLLYDRGTRRGWVVSSTPRPHFAPGKDFRASGPVWRAEKLVPTGIRSQTVQPVVIRYTDWATRPTEVTYRPA